MNLIQLSTAARLLAMAPEGSRDVVRALDQARRPRVSKPADQRRRDILDAATELFRDAGYASTTVQAIAGRAGVAAGTVYLYFPSKEAILSALQQDFESGLLDRFAGVAGEVVEEEVASGVTVGYEEVVDRLIDGMLAYALEHRAAAEVLARHVGRVAVVPEGPILAGGLTELLARVIREGVRLGYVHTTDPDMAAYLLNLAAVSALSNAVATGDEALLDRVVRQTKELYVKALAPRGDG